MRASAALSWPFEVGYLTAKGLANYALGDAKPFHGSAVLMREIAGQITEKKAHTFIETGTFRGDSLRWVAERFPELRCYSCDINPLYVLFTRIRLRRLDNVRLVRK